MNIKNNRSSYSTIFIVSILTGIVGLTPIGCTSPTTLSVQVSPHRKMREAIDNSLELQQGDVDTSVPSSTEVSEQPKEKVTDLDSASINQKQAIKLISDLPEIIVWKQYIQEKTSGKVWGILRVKSETPETIEKKEYWSITFYENQPTHMSRWQSFLVRVDGKEILVDGVEGNYRTLEIWRKQDDPMSRIR